MEDEISELRGEEQEAGRRVEFRVLGGVFDDVFGRSGAPGEEEDCLWVLCG